MKILLRDSVVGADMSYGKGEYSVPEQMKPEHAELLLKWGHAIRLDGGEVAAEKIEKAVKKGIEKR
jgi:ketopantoate hydroxymethyltransferase